MEKREILGLQATKVAEDHLIRVTDIPSNSDLFVGFILQRIREKSGADVQVEKMENWGPKRTLLIKGSEEATQKAHLWIQQIMFSGDIDMTEILGENIFLAKKVIVPKNARSRVLGPGKDIINAIEMLSITTISLNKFHCKGILVIRGSNEGTEKAFGWIQEIINHPTRDYVQILGERFKYTIYYTHPTKE